MNLILDALLSLKISFEAEISHGIPIQRRYECKIG